LDFTWSQEQRDLRASAERFAREELAGEDLAERDQDSCFSRESWRRCADFGALGLPVPVEFGGQGAGALDTVLVLEALGYGCRDNGLLFSLGAHLWSCALPILRFGTQEQKKRYLPALCDGSLIGVQAVTETGSGSDALAVSTTATPTPDGRHFILDGAKSFITNAPVADVFIVLAAVPGLPRMSGLCAFVVERGVPGLSTGAPFGKMGLRTSPLSEVLFQDCRVPAEAMLGTPGSGMTVFNTTIEWERSFILAPALGTMRRQLEESIEHARTHQRFGQPIGRNQAVSHRIADMAVDLEAARLMLYHLAWLKDQGRRTTMESAMVKLLLSESFVRSSTASLETHGAYGYMTGSPQERDLRDALAGKIYSGTTDIQRNIIAGMLGM
jgi:alkylation response protein AidB-like acyl-CoA dehydrogenase